MPSFRLTDDSGAPLTTATPTLTRYRDRSGVARSLEGTTIPHLGGGLYGFTPTPSELSDGVGFLADCGAGSNPRRGAGFVGDDHVFFAGYDAAGAFLAGLTPAITTYVGANGVSLGAAPAIADLTGGLYAFTPTLAQRLAGARFAIDLGASAAPGRYVGGDLGDGQASEPATTTAATTGLEATAGVIKKDLAFDHATGKFIRRNGQLTFTTDRAAIAQAVGILLRTVLGEWFLNVTDGVPYFDQVMIKNPNLTTIEAMLRQKIETVPGIKSVKTLTLTLNKDRTLKVVWLADSDLGEISEAAVIGG